MSATTGNPCPGPCNAAVRATGEGHPRPGDPTWCRPCHARIRRCLHELGYLGAILDYFADGYHEQTTDPRNRGIHAASPSEAAEYLDELEKLLYESEEQYRALKGWGSAPRHGHIASVTTEIIAWLNWHLDGILASALAEPFGVEVQAKHRELMSKTRAGTGRRRKPVPCPRCKLRMLYWEDGDDHLVCHNPQCNRHLSMDEYQEEAVAAARELEPSRGPRR